MGAASRKRTATAQFIEKFPDCFFCGGQRRATTREHMPPKSLFDNSHRPDKLVMPACAECNRGTSTADLTVAIVSRWHHVPRSQENIDHKKLIAQVHRQDPDLWGEWKKLNADPREKEQARHRLIQYGVPVPQDAGLWTIGPLTIRQLNLFAYEAVLALFFEHVQQPLPITGRVCAYWKSKEDFARGGIPRFLLDMLPEYGTLVQGRWNERETFEYRHAANDGFFGCIAKLRRGLFITGFAATDKSVFRPDDGIDCIIPTNPATAPSMPDAGTHEQTFDKKPQS